MIPISLKTIAHITNGILYGNDLIITNVSIDSRQIPLHCLFVAIVGKHYDAHDFINDAIINGASSILVQQNFPINIPKIIVKDTFISFRKLAGWVREQVDIKMLALTGSSGKTSVKEMTASILHRLGKTLYTYNNLNNNFGVPITLLRLTKDHQYAVIELGANNYNEISNNVKLVHPDSALINNIFPAHLEGFKSISGVAKAKGEIFHDLSINGIAIINDDSNDQKNWENYLHNKIVWNFSLKLKKSNFYASNITIFQSRSLFTLHTPRGEIIVNLSVPGYHNITNAIAAASLSMSVNASLDAIKNGLESITPIRGRLFPIQLSKNHLLIDDSYNSNYNSMIVAIKVLRQMTGYRILVVGDMLELGEKTKEYHCNIGLKIKKACIDVVFSIGTMSFFISKYSGVGKHFSKKCMIVNSLRILLLNNIKTTILIKGSRGTAMEKIVHSLQEKLKC